MTKFETALLHLLRAALHSENPNDPKLDPEEQPVALALIESAVFAEQGRRVDIGLCKNGKAILS